MVQENGQENIFVARKDLKLTVMTNFLQKLPVSRSSQTPTFATLLAAANSIESPKDMPYKAPLSDQHHQESQLLTSGSLAFQPNIEPIFNKIIPDIYLTKNFISWTEENLRANLFTHIIIIDKHIQELYYPSPVFKLATSTECTNVADSLNCFEFDDYCQPTKTSSLSFGKEFQAIDLNFGEKSYLTTVLPNCYRAIKFINKAIQSGGKLLVIDCNGGEQKCFTIIVAFLMFKHNISFRDAFTVLKQFYQKADLDRFYMSQLYEYEPILKVQREQSRGQSCSRALHAALLKRKNLSDDSSRFNCDVENKFFNDLINPLSQLKTNDMQMISIKAETDESKAEQNRTVQQQQHQQQQQQQHNICKKYHQLNSGGVYLNCEDYEME